MQDLISRQATIDAYGDWYVEEGTEDGFIGTVKQLLEGLPPAQPDHIAEVSKKVDSDLISRQAAIDALIELYEYQRDIDPTEAADLVRQGIYLAEKKIEQLPSAQPEQRYTKEELRVFTHGISLSLLSKRSAQHWRYDKDTATEIEFLERLYDKVVADMGDEQDG